MLNANRRSELGRFNESSSTLPLDQFSYLLPGPNGPVVSSIIENPARNYKLETQRLQTAEQYLSEEDQLKIIQEAVKAEQDNFQTGRKFLKGFEGSYLSAQSGLQRMLGQDEQADDIQRYLNDPEKQRSLNQLMQMAEKVAPEEAKKLEEELDTGVIGDLAEGAGQLSGQVAMVGTTSAIHPTLGFLTLAGQVTGQNYEGSYQRSKSERLEKLFGEYQSEGLPDQETLTQKMEEVKGQAKGDAFANLWTALPEMFFDRLGLKMASKLLKGKSAGVDKVATFTIGAMAEGASEGTSSFLQNYMVKNRIDPNQEVTEGVLYNIFLGTTLGAGQQTVSGLAGEFNSAGASALLGDVNDFRKQVIKRAKKEAKQGSKRAQDFLDRLDQAMSEATAYDTGGVVTSVSAQGEGKGMTVDGVLEVVNKLHSSDGVPVHILETYDDLKNFDKELASKLGERDGIEGFFDPKHNRVVMFADQLDSEADVQRVLRHEKIGHMGTEAVTGSTGKAFYTMIGMQYADTEIGQKILRNYDNLDLEVLGKEIVARVSENPDLAPKGFRQSMVDKFHELTGNKVESTPETDKLIVNSISLAEQVLDSPDVFNKLEEAKTLIDKDVQTENEEPLFQNDADVRLSIKDKKVTELKAGMTRDVNGNLYYKGVPPQEWTDKQFKEVGDLYGIENFGPLTKPIDVKDEETGKTYKLPGGLDGKFTYFDMLWIKANQPTLADVGEKTHAKITAKLAKSLTPNKIDKVDHFNRLAFGFLSPNAPLLPNEFGLARVLVRDKAQLQELADLYKTYPAKGSKGQKMAWNTKVKAKFDIGSEGAGGLGIGLTQDFGLLANFARLYLKNPDFFVKKSNESWGFFVDRVASQVPGFGTKTASFAGVWQDPFNAMISAIDRHMASNFAEQVLQDPDLKKRYENLIVKKFNEEVVDAQEKEKAFQGKINEVKQKSKDKLQAIEETRLRKHERAKTQEVKDKADEMAERQVAKEKERVANRLEKMGAKREEDLAEAVHPTIPKVETLDDVMAMVKQIGYDKVSTALGKATLAGMSAKGAVYKNKKTGKLNENLSDDWKNFEGFIEDPEKLKIMSDAYKSALDINEQKANDLGIPVFPAQWTLWDRIRQRIEPHEIMFPNLNLLPRMGREQIQETYNMSRTAGYNRAPQTIAKTNVAPSRFVYFSKKDSEPDPVTGLGKFTIRLQADESLPQQIRDNLDPEYTVQAHSEVLEQIKPWFGSGKINYEDKAKDLLVELDQQNLTPEGKMLAGQILVKALGRQADLLRGRLGKKDKTGQLKFDGIVDTNKLDDLAISLATRLAEEARTYGRAVSILQEYGNLRGMALSGVAKKAITNAVVEKVKTEGVTDQQVNDLTEIIKVASEAGFDAISVEFLRKKAPDLVKIIEKQFAPSLWGAYRKDAVGKIYNRVMSAINQQGGKNSTAPLARFTNELVAEIQRRMNLRPGAKKTLRPKTEVLRDALLNAEKYKDVWKGLADKVRNDKSLTKEEKAELMSYFGPIPEVSGQLVESTINERMKAFGVKLNKLVREQMSTKKQTGETLTKAIMRELDLPADIAGKISMRVQSEFNRKMREEAKKQIDAFKKKSNAPKVTQKVKGLEQFVIEMANLGAFERTDVFNELAKKMGIKGTFDTKFAQNIQRLAYKIQNAPEGFQKNDLVQDLLSAIQNKVEEGDKWSALGTLAMSIRQANLVSGVSTQLINLTSNIATMGGMTATQAMRSGFNPNIMYTIFRNMMNGLVKGKDEAKQVILTGRGRRGFEMDKHAFDPILERKTLKGGKLNPYNYLKHVHRFMSALDTMFRFTNIEGKASFLSAMEAKKKGLSGKALRDYVNESLKNTSGFVNSAKAQASKEGLSGLNHTRRVNEILESLRDPEIKQESEQYGLRSTYQNVPEGLLGAMASWIAQGAYPPHPLGETPPNAKKALSMGLQFFIPFIRVVANVQNMTIDYTPILGATRAVWHKHFKGAFVRKKQPYSEEAYQDLMARNLLGTALAGALGYLFFREEDDEDNRMFDITAGGPTNLQKRNTLMDSGWKPYTITWNGKQIGYKETPFGGFLAFMGGIKDANRYEDDQPTTANLISAGTMAFGRLMFDQAFFKGVSDGIAMVRFDDMSGYFWTKTAKGAPKQFLVPNLFNQIDNALHNKKYTVGDLESQLGFMMNHYLPFQRGMPKLDPFGQPVERYNGEMDWDNFFARVYDQEQKDSLVKKLARHKIIPTKPNKGTDIRDEDDELSDLHRAQDLYLYHEIKGRHLKNFLMSYDTSDPNIPSQLEAKDTQIVEAVYKSLNRSAGEVAKYKVRNMNRAQVLTEIGRIKKSFED